MSAAGRAPHAAVGARRGGGDYCLVSMLSVLATLAVVTWTGPPLQRPRLGVAGALLSRWMTGMTSTFFNVGEPLAQQTLCSSRMTLVTVQGSD